MISTPVRVTLEPPMATIDLSDPARRNALGTAMFDGLERAIADIAVRQDVHVVLLQGEGEAFCAGFDLKAVAEDHALLAHFILRLSATLRGLRRMPQVVVAAVQGPAIAGGCAILSACDFVIVAADARLGYPVHGLGVSPAVSIHTLAQAIGGGPARCLLLSGELIDGRRACRLGLATRLCGRSEDVRTQSQVLCSMLADKPPVALRATKAWLNELDGSMDESAFTRPARGSAEPAAAAEFSRAIEQWRRTTNVPSA